MSFMHELPTRITLHPHLDDIFSGYGSRHRRAKVAGNVRSRIADTRSGVASKSMIRQRLVLWTASRAGDAIQGGMYDRSICKEDHKAPMNGKSEEQHE
jgi:hypothetical protein